MTTNGRRVTDYSLTFESSDGLSYYISRRLLDEHGMLAVFTTRQGGIGLGPYSSLNLAFHVGDDPRTVIKNREAVCRLFNLDPAVVTCAEQVHGSEIAAVTDLNAGAGAFSIEDSIKGVDALITDREFTPLALFFADCMPVILVEPQKRAIGVIHAGWRGVYGQIIERAVAAMVQRWLVSPGKLLAFIGPSIGGCCYQVGSDLRERFTERFDVSHNWLHGDKIDLRALGQSQLIKSGIEAGNVYLNNDSCTSCRNELFFSYRAESGKTGRQSALAAIVAQ